MSVHALLRSLPELALIVSAYRDDMVHREVAEYACLDLNLLCISLPLHLVASLKLLACHDVLALKHLDVVLVEIALEDLRARSLAVKTATLALLNPLVRVAVALEMDRLAELNVLAYNVEDGAHLVLTLLDESVNTLLEVLQSLSHSGVRVRS